jgi:hypothetical protein
MSRKVSEVVAGNIGGWAGFAKWNEHDTYTAWQLCGDRSWREGNYRIKIKGGKTLYEDATAAKGYRSVRLAWLRNDLKQFTRYVDPETPMQLVKEA